MQNAKLKMQKEERKPSLASSILHFTFLILHSSASSALKTPLADGLTDPTFHGKQPRAMLYSEPKIEHRLMSSFVQYHNQRFN